MVDEKAEALRDMAQHRGLKLIRSRRRKPGSGDFGKFGLADEQGRPLFGIGDDGLTASAKDIEDYLRAGANRTWQQSAKMPPARAPRPARRKAKQGPVEDPRPAKPAKRAAQPMAKPSASRRVAKPPREPARTPSEVAAVKPQPVETAPSLVLRAAKPGDAAALAGLLGQLSGVAIEEDVLARHLAALRAPGAGVTVAEMGGLVGCVGWAVVPTLQRGPVGRITVLVVDQARRREGIGRRLLAEAEAALAKKGCSQMEVMSDIAIKNAHNFFRAAKFEQTSYRFARQIAG